MEVLPPRMRLEVIHGYLSKVNKYIIIKIVKDDSKVQETPGQE